MSYLLRRALKRRKEYLISYLIKNGNYTDREYLSTIRTLTELEEEYKKLCMEKK
ncbi:Fur-regulated basic protein FbpA [Peribacillus kribbensis]|uniref:Fur-regulated basic protein FbpA n=1 Tax=Peribacillus kribbensis TaxID=356658 RepID=UPI0003F8D0C7